MPKVGKLLLILLCLTLFTVALTFSVSAEEASDDTVRITWNLPATEPYTELYQKNTPIQVPQLPESKTVNGNTYTLAWDEIPELATEDATYSAKWTGGAKLSANYTLDSSIDFNAFVPVSSEITHVNGTPVAELSKKSLAAKQFWMVTFPNLAPKDAYESQLVALTVKLDEDYTVVVERYISLVGYAKSALKSEASSAIKNLVLHTLDYINKAHMYFEEDAESVEQIDELLTTYEFTPYEWSERNVKEMAGSYENVLGVGLDLSQKPGFAIYVSADYEGSVMVNGRAYNSYFEVPISKSEYAKCVIIEMKAYNMTRDLSISVGDDLFEFNLDTFIKNNAADEPYAHALYGYAKAAEDYLKTQK